MPLRIACRDDEIPVNICLPNDPIQITLSIIGNHAQSTIGGMSGYPIKKPQITWIE
jgi:hypothetical protein